MSEKNNNKQMIALIVAIIFAFGFGFLPTIPGLTQVGMELTGIFIGMLIAWLMVDLATGSVLAMIAISLSSYATSPKAFIVSFLGNNTTVVIIAVLLLAALLRANKLENLIVSKMMNLKIAKGRPYVVFSMWMITYFLITQFCGGGPIGIFIILPMFFEMFKQAGYRKGDKQVVAFFLGMLLTAGCATIDLPIAAMGVIFMGLMEKFGMAITPLTYTAYALPMTFVMIAGYIFYCKFIWRVDFSKLADVNIGIEEVAMTKRQKAALALFIITLVAMMFGSVNIPGLGVLYSMGNIGIIYTGILIGMLLPVEGKPIIDLREVGKYFEWTMFFFACAIATVPSAFASEATGVRTLLLGILQPIAAQTNSLTILVFALVVTVLLTNFINNSVAGVLMITICATMATALPDMNLVLVICIVMFACEFGLLTPMASGSAACLCAQTEWVAVRDMMKYGFFLLIWCSFLLIVVGGFWSGVVFVKSIISMYEKSEIKMYN